VEVRGVRQVALGAGFTCITDSSDRASCWGGDLHGEHGDGDADPRPSAAPLPVAGEHRFTTLAAGRRHACGLTVRGAAWCWGNGGALGDGNVADRRTPVEVLGSHSFTDITAGESVTCAVDDTAAAWCWGIAFEGQLGQGTPPTPNTLIPIPVAGGIRFRTLAAGHHRVCGLDLEGQAWCWGSNYNGGLGDGGSVRADAPVRVAGERRYTAIAAGDYHTCALDEQGAAWCWGENSDARGGGALGDGTVRSRPTPTRVATPTTAERS
jgi:alpha-tubulin suppressor-like RCC1 family protein